MQLQNGNDRTEKIKKMPGQSKNDEKKKSPKSAAKYVAPSIVAVVAILFALLLVYPIMKLSPHNVPIAICSLDAGASAFGTDVNAGDLLIDQLTQQGEDSAQGSDADSGEDDSESGGMFSVGTDSVSWTVFDSEDDMNQALERGDFYAAITIPEDFSQRMVSVKGRQALGDKLVSMLPQLAEGSAALSNGAGQLSDGSQQLSQGIGTLAQGAQTLDGSVSSLPESTQKLQAGSSSLASGLSQAKTGSSQLSDGIGQTSAVASNVESLIAAASAALQNGEYEQASLYLLQASKANAGTQQALEQLGAGAASLTAGIDSAAQGAQALNSGLSALSSGADALSQGTAALAQGAGSAYDGSVTLSEGSQQLSDGASTLSEGLATAQDALNGLPSQAASDNGGEEGLDIAADADATSLSLSASDDDPDAPFISLRINPSKNPMVSNSLQSAFTGLSAYGVSVRSSTTAEIPAELNSGYAHMPLLIMTYLASYAAAAVISMALKPRRNKRSAMAKGLLAQVLVSLVAAIIVGMVAGGVFKAATGAPTDFVQLAAFLALCSFALQLAVVASLDLMGTPGMVVPLLLMALCMLCAYLPYEFLPDFWQNCIYPWNPLRYMVDGFKAILYTGGGAINSSTGAVLALAAIGAVVMALNMLKKPKGDAE